MGRSVQAGAGGQQAGQDGTRVDAGRDACLPGEAGRAAGQGTAAGQAVQRHCSQQCSQSSCLRWGCVPVPSRIQSEGLGCSKCPSVLSGPSARLQAGRAGRAGQQGGKEGQATEKGQA